jgi:hypothetical protein
MAVMGEGRESSRIEGPSRLGEAVKELTGAAVADRARARMVVHQLVPTLGRCNELAFGTLGNPRVHHLDLTDRSADRRPRGFLSI